MYPWDLPKILHVIWIREEEGILIYEGSQWKDHCQTGRIKKHFHHVNVKLEWRATSIHEDFTCLFHFCNRIYLLSENSDESWNLQILHISILQSAPFIQIFYNQELAIIILIVVRIYRDLPHEDGWFQIFVHIDKEWPTTVYPKGNFSMSKHDKLSSTQILSLSCHICSFLLWRSLLRKTKYWKSLWELCLLIKLQAAHPNSKF
jgi:hypothetical protein